MRTTFYYSFEPIPQDSFIKYDNPQAYLEFREFINVDGNIAVEELDSQTRNGWTQLPFCIPYGVVVTHAAINIGSWICMLSIKINV